MCQFEKQVKFFVHLLIRLGAWVGRDKFDKLNLIPPIHFVDVHVPLSRHFVKNARAGKGYYKGKGGTKEGRLTSKGRFIVDSKKRLELIVPDLEGFQVGSRKNRLAV